VGRKSPEGELEEFLAAQPSWVRKLLQADPLTPDEQAHLTQSGWPETFGQARDKFLQLLQQCPAQLREYRKREARQGVMSALQDIPALPVGAPRKEWLTQEASELQRAGLSHREIADELNKKHPGLTDGNGNVRLITAEVVRKQLASLRKRTSPEKT
jgi:hypothetical protein